MADNNEMKKKTDKASFIIKFCLIGSPISYKIMSTQYSLYQIKSIIDINELSIQNSINVDSLSIDK